MENTQQKTSYLILILLVILCSVLSFFLYRELQKSISDVIYQQNSQIQTNTSNKVASKNDSVDIKENKPCSDTDSNIDWKICVATVESMYSDKVEERYTYLLKSIESEIKTQTELKEKDDSKFDSYSYSSLVGMPQSLREFNDLQQKYKQNYCDLLMSHPSTQGTGTSGFYSDCYTDFDKEYLKFLEEIKSYWVADY